jgi:hypothetical protein
MKKFSIALLPLAISATAFAEDIVDQGDVSAPNAVNQSVAFSNSSLDNSGNWESFDSSTVWFNPANLSNFDNQLSIVARGEFDGAVVFGDENKFALHYGRYAQTVGTDRIDFAWSANNIGAALNASALQDTQHAITSVSVDGTFVELQTDDSFTYQDPSSANSDKYEVNVTENSIGEMNMLFGASAGMLTEKYSISAYTDVTLSGDGNNSEEQSYEVRKTTYDASNNVTGTYYKKVDDKTVYSNLELDSGVNISYPLSEVFEVINIATSKFKNSEKSIKASTKLQYNTDASGALETDSLIESDKTENTSEMEFANTTSIIFNKNATANVKLQFGQGITAKYSSTEMTEETVSSSSTATTLGTTAQNNEGTFHVALPFSAKLQAQMTPSFVARAAISGSAFQWENVTKTRSTFYSKSSGSSNPVSTEKQADILESQENEIQMIDSISASFGFGYTPIKDLTIDVNISGNEITNISSLTATYTF